MGIDTGLAIDGLRADFVCSICHDIVQNPVEISSCEHHFCDGCVRPWIQANSDCPIDRLPVEEAGLSQPRRFYRNTLAEVRLRCQFSACNAETTYEGFERHKTNCPENPEAWIECTFCHVKHMINEEETHQKSCLPFLHDKIARNESEKKELEKEFRRKREADKKQCKDEIERVAKKSRTMRYIFTWNAKFPNPENHQQSCDDFYYTWQHHVGNMVSGTSRRARQRFKLDHGEMAVGLCLDKETDQREICIQVFLTTCKKARVKFIVSLSLAGKVLWQKERSEELEVESNRKDGFTGGHISDDLPSDLPSKLLVVVEVLEWEPNTE